MKSSADGNMKHGQLKAGTAAWHGSGMRGCHPWAKGDADIG